MVKAIRVPRQNASEEDRARFWRTFGKIVRGKAGAGLIGIKY